LSSGRFKDTLIAIATIYIVFYLSSIIPIDFIFSSGIYRFNFFLTIFFPFFSFLVYFLKGLIGTEIIVRLFNYKLDKYDITNKIKAFDFVIMANKVTVKPIDELNIKPKV
jgi:hypothetical protein